MWAGLVRSQKAGPPHLSTKRPQLHPQTKSSPRTIYSSIENGLRIVNPADLHLQEHGVIFARHLFERTSVGQPAYLGVPGSGPAPLPEAPARSARDSTERDGACPKPHMPVFPRPKVGLAAPIVPAAQPMLPFAAFPFLASGLLQLTSAKRLLMHLSAVLCMQTMLGFSPDGYLAVLLRHVCTLTDPPAREVGIIGLLQNPLADQVCPPGVLFVQDLEEPDSRCRRTSKPMEVRLGAHQTAYQQHQIVGRQSLCLLKVGAGQRAIDQFVTDNVLYGLPDSFRVISHDTSDPHQPQKDPRQGRIGVCSSSHVTTYLQPFISGWSIHCRRRPHSFSFSFVLWRRM